MSIPKEPRQLMINLMYIVLTAMLALNVSAEVLQAFVSMNSSISDSNRIVGLSNEEIITAIEAQADAYPQYKSYNITAKKAQQLAKNFYGFIETQIPPTESRWVNLTSD